MQQKFTLGEKLLLTWVALAIVSGLYIFHLSATTPYYDIIKGRSPASPQGVSK